jgi:hypothetical protein
VCAVIQSQVASEEALAASGEGDSRSQASYLNVVDSEDIGQYSVLALRNVSHINGVERGMVTYRRNLSRKVNALGDLDHTSLNRALEINIADLLAEVGLGADKTDQTVLDSQKNIGALLNLLLDRSLGLDQEFLATIKMLVPCHHGL